MTAITKVDPQEWRSTIAAQIAQGWCSLDHLTAIDRVGAIEVVIALRSPETGDLLMMSTATAGEEACLPCVCDLLPAANWHEREAAEMFGLAFEGHGPMEPLLVRGAHREGQPPLLLRSTPLPARMTTPWPGAEGAKRQRVPGINPEWSTGEAP